MEILDMGTLDKSYYSSDGKTLRTNMVRFNGKAVIDPSGWTYGEQDISTADAGRDEAGTMWDDKIAQKVQYQLEWAAIDPVNAAEILQAVGDMKHFEATLFDAKLCAYVTRTFYVGDRTAPMQQWMPDRVDGKIFSKVSFTIIEV